MKYNNLRWMAAAMIAIAIVSCSPHNEDVFFDGELKTVRCVVPSFDSEEDFATGRIDTIVRTKATLTSTSFLWSKGDLVGIIPDKGSQIYFEVDKGAGTSSASFDGGAWALKASNTYWSYYPFYPDIFLNKSHVPVSFVGQKQKGNNSLAHTGDYWCLYSGATSTTTNTLTFSYHHLTSLFKTYVNLPAGTYTNVTFKTDEPIFIEDGYFDLSEGEPAIIPQTVTNHISLNLEDVVFTSERELIAQVVVAPVEIANIPVTVIITASDGSLYEYTLAKANNMVASKTYALRATAVSRIVGSVEDANNAMASGIHDISFSTVPTDPVNLSLPDSDGNVSIAFPVDGEPADISIIYPENAQACTGNLSLTAPSGTNLNINTPETTVTLNGKSYGNVTSRTASNTLIISEGVHVDYIKVLKGGVVVYGSVDRIDLSEQEDNSSVDATGTVGELLGEWENLSQSGTANCYVVHDAGDYAFRAVKGNGIEQLAEAASADVLWESVGTTTAPAVGSIIKSAELHDGYVRFSTAGRFKDGNALIAVRDANGTILWSWHIWCTSEGFNEDVYLYGNGTMMDRNLGALSAGGPNASASSINMSAGLLYQWGRKDPFPGAADASSSTANTTRQATSITWPAAVSTNAARGTIEYSIQNPTTFITEYTNTVKDWLYSTELDNSRWSSEKTIYDPCPAGWRVPDGGASNGVWALGTGTTDGIGKGMTMSLSPKAWYPFAADMTEGKGAISNAANGCYMWSCTPDAERRMKVLVLYGDGKYYTNTSSSSLARGSSVRCQKIGTGGGIDVTGVTLDKESVSLLENETIALSASVVPSAAYQKVTWTTSNAEVATVSDDGLVTAIGSGEATIKAASYMDSNKFSICTITVSVPKPKIQAVDLGLSVPWCNVNVGAEAPEECGYYFAWGEVSPKTDYTWGTYLYANGPYTSFTSLLKYNTSENYGMVDSLTVLEPEDDAAHVIMGDLWRMPTFDEVQELIDNCTVEVLDASFKFIGPNGNSILIPKSGYRTYTATNAVGLFCRMWTSSLSITKNSGYAIDVDVSSGKDIFVTNTSRYYGEVIRPVYDFYPLSLSLSSSSLDVTEDSSRSSFTCSLKNERPHTSLSATANVSWITGIDVDGNTISFSVESNSTSNLREGIITVSYADATEQFKIRQRGRGPVDLGLSVKWGSYNLGAFMPEDSGDYFAWGELGPKESYTQANYLLSNKYRSNNATLETGDDAAAVNMGVGWRIPTPQEWNELFDDSKCSWELTTQNDVLGYLVTSKIVGYTNNSIFLPLTGWKNGDSLYNNGRHGAYWSSTLTQSYNIVQTAYFYPMLDADGNHYNDKFYMGEDYRWDGRAVRPVFYK